MEACGELFEDYRIIIYENNSEDNTRELYLQWAQENPKVVFLYEDLTLEMIQQFSKPLGDQHYIQTIAHARNEVLKEALDPEYENFPYLIMCDMDFLSPWPIKVIKDTFLNPERDWDAIFANGINTKGVVYDMMAFRSPEHPIGPELIGWAFYGWEDRWFSLPQSHPWLPVYSAFNGLAIYKREAIKGSKYTAYPTEDVEIFTKALLEKARDNNHYLYRWYMFEYTHAKAIYRYDTMTKDLRKTLGKSYFTTLDNKPDRIAWMVYTDTQFLPIICEHISLNAALWAKGYRKMYINPALVLCYEDS